MDPQALAALEECLNLWYHAGYTPDEIKGEAIGVYLGGRSRHRPGEEKLLDAKTRSSRLARIIWPPISLNTLICAARALSSIRLVLLL